MEQPYSTLSNAVYPIVGILIFHISWAVGLTYILLGIASTGFHALQTRAWHKFDIVAIFYALGALAGFLWFGNAGVFLGIVVASFGHAVYDEWMEHRLSRPFIGILGALCIIPYAMQNDFPTIFYALGCFAVAFLLGQLAESEIIKNPYIYDCLHAIWHVFSGLGFLFLTNPDLITYTYVA